MDTFRMTVYSQEQKKRQEELDQDFPNAVSKNYTSGNSWNEYYPRDQGDSPERHFPDLSGTDTVVKEMNRSSTLQGAFTRMQCRCSNKYLDKMITVISKELCVR